MSTPGSLAHVLRNPPGTVIRRSSWPAHWSVTIAAERSNGNQALKYTALIDLGSHPMGAPAMLGDTITFFQIPTADAVADDWVQIDSERVKLDTGPMPEFGIWCGNGRVGRPCICPVSKLPAIEGYRSMSVYVPIDMFDRVDVGGEVAMTDEQREAYVRTGKPDGSMPDAIGRR